MWPPRATSRLCRLSGPPATVWRSLQRASASMCTSAAPIVSQPSPSRAGTGQGDVAAGAGLSAATTADKPANSKADSNRGDRHHSRCHPSRAPLMHIATFDMVELARWIGSRFPRQLHSRLRLECELSSVLTTRVASGSTGNGKQKARYCFTTKKTYAGACPRDYEDNLRGHGSDYRA